MDHKQESKMEAELIRDKNDPSAYRVEAIDTDGGVQVATFSGPLALGRALAFAGAYYESWRDPHGLAS